MRPTSRAPPSSPAPRRESARSMPTGSPGGATTSSSSRATTSSDEALAADAPRRDRPDRRGAAADLSRRDGVAQIEQRLADDAAIALLINNAGMSLEGDMLDNGPAEAMSGSSPSTSPRRRCWPPRPPRRSRARRRAPSSTSASVLALAPENFTAVPTAARRPIC